jgi:hypothetical protein
MNSESEFEAPRPYNIFAMRVPYIITKSRFTAPILEAIDAGGGCVRQGHPVHVILSQEGYDGQVLATIDSGDTEHFEATWDGTDVSRFPVRIRAAATALRDRRCFGTFVIQHSGGLLIIGQL